MLEEVQAPPSPGRVSTTWLVAGPLALALVAGGAISLQAFVLGRLATHVGSIELAATAHLVVSSIVLFAAAMATGVPVRAFGRVHKDAGVRWWHLVAWAAAGVTIVVISSAVSKVGVALVTVALVCGQTTGSLIIDRLALSPAGKGHLTVARVLGAALALGAVVIAALGSDGDVHLGLLALAVLGGASFALGGAAMGRVGERTNQPLIGAWLNMATGAVVVVIIWLAVTGGTAPDGWSAPAVQWIVPGCCGAVAVFIMAKVVARLGALRLMLGLVAGQSIVGLVLDLIAPVPGQSVTFRTVLGVVLTLVAVAVSGLGGHAMRRTPPSDGAAG